MIVRRRFQFRGAIRIVLGVAGMLFTLLSLRIAIQRTSEVTPFVVVAIEGLISVLVFGSGLRARSKPPLFRIDELGFHFNLDSDEPGLVQWSEVIHIRQCGEHLTIFSTNEHPEVFHCHKLNKNIELIAAECLNQIRKACGLAPIRDSILAAPPELCCQKCGKATSSLKGSLFIVIVFAFVYNFAFRKESLTCPRCTRRSVYKSAIINLPLSNLIWPIIILPLCACQWFNSFRNGHSRSVIDMLENQRVKELTA